MKYSVIKYERFKNEYNPANCNDLLYNKLNITILEHFFKNKFHHNFNISIFPLY